MKTTLRILTLALFIFGAAGGALAALEELAWAQRITCEVTEPSGSSLDRLTFQQGTTPLVAFDVIRAGRAISTDTGVTARLVFGASATGAIYAAVTNYAWTNNTFVCQCPTIGTNSATATNGLWWYTVYYDRAGRTFWTGNGELVIEETTSTAEDGIEWQPTTFSGQLTAHNTNTAAHADIRALTTNATDTSARAMATTNATRIDGIEGKTNNWNGAFDHTTESSNTVHGGFIRAAFDWATNAYTLAGSAWTQATNAYRLAGDAWDRATIAWGWGNHATNGYVTIEADPVFDAWAGGGYAGVVIVETDPDFTYWAESGYPGVVQTNDTRYLAALTNAAAFVPTNRTISVNGQVGTLDSNVALTLSEAGSAITNMLFWAGPAATQSATNAGTVYFTW